MTKTIEAGIPYKHVAAAFALSAVAAWVVYIQIFPYGFSAPLQPLAIGLLYCLCLTLSVILRVAQVEGMMERGVFGNLKAPQFGVQ